jgi:uncharacterized membrane-anchored protein
MIEFHAYFGGLSWWILVRFCRTKLADEQSDKNRRRNLYFLSFLNIIVAFIVIIFLMNTRFFSPDGRENPFLSAAADKKIGRTAGNSSLLIT